MVFLFLNLISFLIANNNFLKKLTEKENLEKTNQIPNYKKIESKEGGVNGCVSLLFHNYILIFFMCDYSLKSIRYTSLKL